MNGVTITAHDIFQNIRDLPPESLNDLAEYIEFLRFKRVNGDSVESSMPVEFEKAVAAFDKLKPELMRDYGGQAVAIYRDEVVAVGDDKMSVLDAVLQNFGPIPCYIEWVETEAPRRVRVPSTWVAS